MIPSIDSEVCQGHRYYYCKPCNQSVRGSAKGMNEHYFGNKHLKKLREYEGSLAHQKPKLKMLQGSTQSLDSSKSEKSVKKPAKKERLNSLPAQQIPRVPKPNPAETNIPKKFSEFMFHEDLDNATALLISEGCEIMNSQVYKKVCNLLERQLLFRFPDICAYPFGSMVIGLGRIGGDLDIFIDIGQCYFEKPSKRKMKDAIHQIQRILSQNSNNGWSDFEPVTKARTPILRAYCRSEEIDCDLSFSNGLSCCNTALIGHFIELQPVCKKLNAFIKFWVSKLQLGINSYIVSQLVIFYLQHEKLLPSVQKLQSFCEPVIVDGWHANFAPVKLHQLKIPLATDFKKYLKGFFHFYGHEFDYDRHIISILAGAPVEKVLFDHGKEENLPPIFQRFTAYMSKIDLNDADEVEDLFSNFKPLVIQDPFELCHNVAKGVQHHKLKKIINYMQRSHEILTSRKNF